MTERSYLWDGLVTGDATLAPYDASEFNKYLNSWATAYTNNALVVPGYLDSLEILAAGNSSYSSIRILAGAALVQNLLYVSDAEEFFNIASNLNTGYHRYDTLVLRQAFVDQSDGQEAQTVRLALVQGVESATFPPTATALVQDLTDIWETELARIYINSTSFIISAEYVQEKRNFLNTFEDQPVRNQNNLIRNSEFIAFSGIASNQAPDAWDLVATPTTSGQTRRSPATRGRAVGIGGSVGEGISQTISVTPTTKHYSMLGVMRLTSGGTGGAATLTITGYRSNGLLDPKSATFTIRNTGQDETFRLTVHFQNDDVVRLLVKVVLSDVTDAPTAIIGQLILVPGFNPGGFRYIHETIMCAQAVTDANWTDTAKSSGTTNLDLTATFGNLTLAYTRGVILLGWGRDSGSAGANDVYMRVSSNPTGTIYGELQIGRAVADRRIARQFVVPVDDDFIINGTEIPSFRVVIGATGAGTFDATLRIVGFIT